MQLSASNIDKAIDALKDTANRIKSVSGKVTFAELFTKEFMNKYTKFDNIDDFLHDCGFSPKSLEDFNEVKSGAYDTEISSRTEFSGWEEMKSTAVREYAINKING